VQIKACPQTGYGTPTRLLIPLAFAHRLLQPGCKQSTNGRAFLGCENTNFPQEISLDLQRDIGFRFAPIYVQHYSLCSA
jgi:hypothetical protein